MCSNSSPEIRILIADNDPLAIATIKRYLFDEKEIKIVGEVTNGIDALEKLKRIKVDVVLAAIRMPVMDGISLLHEMRTRKINTHFIALTALDNDTTMIEVLKNGGVGYIVKSATQQELINAVKSVANGCAAISPQPLSRLVAQVSPSPSATDDADISSVADEFATLNDMEKQVLDNLCCGKSNAEIAHTLQYSEATVKKYISSLKARFNANSRLHLAIMVIDSGFIRRQKKCVNLS